MGHFKIVEFDCNCKNEKCPAKSANGELHIAVSLICALERVRVKLGKPITIRSGMRCKPYNKLVGGVVASQHMLGTAADITCAKTDLTALYMLCLAEPALTAIGDGRISGGFIHVDVRPNAGAEHGGGKRKEWTYN